MGYEQIRVVDELSERAGRIPLQRRETLGELVRSMVAQRGACRREDLISREPTRYDIRGRAKGGAP